MNVKVLTRLRKNGLLSERPKAGECKGCGRVYMNRVNAPDLFCRCGDDPVVSLLPVGYLMVIEYGENDA